jgi:hypothetical protein
MAKQGLFFKKKKKMVERWKWWWKKRKEVWSVQKATENKNGPNYLPNIF